MSDKLKQNLTLGSLFSGSGGFELAGLLSGIKPVWASEVEPFPIRVTTKRMPFVEHLGEISQIDGGAIEPVDIITFGSPCQDLSIAGTKKGLTGNRSNLFYEATRVIKEMREKTNGRYPRYIVWENVRGAFSSNKGNDFWKVLKEITSIKGCKTDIPRPEKWANAGLIMGEDFSVGWRLFDSQHWGVPQRRKRIYLVADFAGGGAGKILFESEGVSGYSAEGFEAWKGTARNTEGSAGAAGSICLNDQGGERMDVSVDISGTLRAQDHGHPPVVMAADFCTEPSAKSRSIGYEDETSPTLRAGVVPAAITLEHHPHDSRIRIANDDISQTLNNRMGTGGNNVPLIMEGAAPKTERFSVRKKGGGKGVLIQTNESATLACNNDQILFQPVYSTVKTDYHVRFVKNKIGALVESDYRDPPIIYDSTNKHEYIIRRLTPIECARLQGFPDWWCSNLETENPTEEDIKFWTDVFETHRKVITKKKRPKTKNQIVKWLKNPHKDSAEYKMWGNGITLPVAVFVLSGIVWADSDDCKTG